MNNVYVHMRTCRFRLLSATGLGRAYLTNSSTAGLVGDDGGDRAGAGSPHPLHVMGAKLQQHAGAALGRVNDLWTKLRARTAKPKGEHVYHAMHFQRA